MRLLFLLLTTILGLGLGASAKDYSTPASGTPLRKQIMNTIRVPAEQFFGQEVIFKVQTLRVSSQYAFFILEARQPNGSPVDYRKSPQYRDDPQVVKDEVAAGTFHGGVGGLLKKKSDGSWRVLDILYDANDVFWVDYTNQYGAPKAMIDDPIE